MIRRIINPIASAAGTIASTYAVIAAGASAYTMYVIKDVRVPVTAPNNHLSGDNNYYGKKLAISVAFGYSWMHNLQLPVHYPEMTRDATRYALWKHYSLSNRVFVDELLANNKLSTPTMMDDEGRLYEVKTQVYEKVYI